MAYASLLPAQRRALHARIVDVLESWQREGREELVERLAHHAIQAEAWEKAVDYARRAGLQAMARSAHRDAAAWFDQAVAALGHLPERRELLEQAIDIQFDLRNALWPLAEFRRVFDCLKRAEQLATTLGDQRRLAMAFALLTPMFSTRDDRAQGIEYGRRALDIGAALGDTTVQVVASLYLAMAYVTLGNYSQGDEVRPEEHRPAPAGTCAARALRPARPARPAGHSSPGAPALGPRRARRVRARRSPCSRRACASPRRSTIPTPQTFLALGEGILRVRQGDLPRAVSTLERSLALCRHWKLAALFDVIAGHLGAAYTLAGRRAEAIPLLEEALAREHRHWLEPVPVAGDWPRPIYGRGGSGRATSRRSGPSTLARQRGQRGYEAWIRWLLGEIAAQTDAADAPDCPRPRSTTGRRSPSPPSSGCGRWPPTAIWASASGIAGAGDPAQARGAPGARAELYGEMDLTLWLAQVEAEPVSA